MYDKIKRTSPEEKNVFFQALPEFLRFPRHIRCHALSSGLKIRPEKIKQDKMLR